MKPTALLVAAAAVLALAASPVGAVQKPPPLPARHHVVAVQQVRAVEAVRRAVWACQRAVQAPVTRAAADHQQLTAAGWRYLLWVKATWHERLDGCQAVRQHRQRILDTLARGLAGSPLAPYAAVLEQEGRRWNVSPYLMAAIAGTESNFGRVVPNPGNAWGLGCCIWFADFGVGIRYLAPLLARDYDLTSTATVGRRYAASSRWPSTTAWFMQARFGASSSALRYPLRE